MSNGVQCQPAKIPNYSPVRMFLWQALCILLAAGFVWTCIACEWPCRYFMDPRAESRWAQAGFLASGILLLGLLALLPVVRHWQVRRSGSVTICSYCRKVHVADRAWEHFEVFFSNRRLAQVSHGVCPDCSDRVMQQYRNGDQDAGAPEPVADSA